MPLPTVEEILTEANLARHHGHHGAADYFVGMLARRFPHAEPAFIPSATPTDLASPLTVHVIDRADLIDLASARFTVSESPDELFTLAQMLAANSEHEELLVWLYAARVGDVWRDVVTVERVR